MSHEKETPGVGISGCHFTSCYILCPWRTWDINPKRAYKSAKGWSESLYLLNGIYIFNRSGIHYVRIIDSGILALPAMVPEPARRNSA